MKRAVGEMLDMQVAKLLEDKDKEKQEWEELLEVNLSVGDFSAYVNCAERIIEILNENKDPELKEEIEAYKNQLYDSIAENLYDYVPNKNSKIAHETLKNIEKTADTDRIIRLCNKMICNLCKEKCQYHRTIARLSFFPLKMFYYHLWLNQNRKPNNQIFLVELL